MDSNTGNTASPENTENAAAIPAEPQAGALSANGFLLEPFTAPAGVGSPAPAKPSIEQLVDDWFHRHFHGLAGSLHESLFTHANAAKEELKKVLRELA